MILSTTDGVVGMEVTQTLGLVMGSTVRARFFVRDFLAGIKSMIGGEVATYTRMLVDAREQALVRMTEEAESKGADAVVNVRFATSAVMRQAAELLAYGTAVKLRKAAAR
jgi:uncharacterized protein YbjQ (UPF0145 family)